MCLKALNPLLLSIILILGQDSTSNMVFARVLNHIRLLGAKLLLQSVQASDSVNAFRMQMVREMKSS